MTDHMSHTLSGLITKRAEIAARIVDARAALRQLIIDLDNIDAAIRIFDPSYSVEAFKPQAPLAPHGVSFKDEFPRDPRHDARGQGAGNDQ